MLHVLQLLGDFPPDPLPRLYPWTSLGTSDLIPSIIDPQLSKPTHAPLLQTPPTVTEDDYPWRQPEFAAWPGNVRLHHIA